jgi:hypothetical protein
VGLVTNPKAKSLVLDSLMLLDCGRGLGLRFGGISLTNNSAFLINSYINPLSRPLCDSCYKDNKTPCSNSIGMRLLVSSENTLTLPEVFGDDIQAVTQP